MSIKTDLSRSKFDTKILEKFHQETPFFLFSRESLKNKFQEFQKYFPGALIHFAIKANSEIALIQTLKDSHACFEIASKHELNILKDLKIPCKDIIYGTSVKPLDHIKEAFDYGIDRFAFDSFQELEKIAAMAPNSRVYVRVVANDTGSVFKMSEKFGTEVDNVIPLLQKAVSLGLRPYGISFNVGSQASNSKAWAHAIQVLRPTIENLKDIGIKIETLNLGGGYPSKYLSSEDAPELKEIAHYIYEEYNKLSFQPQLILEPGRAIVAEAGVLIATIIARIERRGITWLFLDAGVYNALYEAMAYQGSTRYPVTSMRSAFDSGEMMFALAGPTGDGPDIITKEVLLPRDMDVGDRLIIHNVGAYSLVVTSPFNGFPKPSVYFI
ncbi:type III PLP-dependent enzyme [Candidatus Parcubacteria bacterium]|nr:type III PLP-dependent enzyme [Candidatus Parcubacteria bacterium]